VVGLECVAVGVAERIGEFLGGVGDVVAEGLGGEVEAAADFLVLYNHNYGGKGIPVQP
jgi:hypothetical protein